MITNRHTAKPIARPSDLAYARHKAHQTLTRADTQRVRFPRSVCFYGTSAKPVGTTRKQNRRRRKDVASIQVSKTAYAPHPEFIRRAVRQALPRYPETHVRVLWSLAKLMLGKTRQEPERSALMEYITRCTEERLNASRRRGYTTHAQVVQEAKGAIIELEDSLRHMVQRGHRVRRELPQNRQAIQTRTPGSAKCNCFIICTRNPDGTLQAIAVKTPGQYRRTEQRRIRTGRSPEQYCRPHPSARHR